MGAKKKFTPEELKHLQANPYTLRVTADSISYTLAFKEAFWALSLQGYTGTAAFRKLGYNCIGAFDVPDRRTDPGGRHYHGNKKRRSTQLRPGTGCGMNFSGNKKAECPLQDTQIL